MRILERYIFREVLQNWLGVTFVLLLILLSNALATVLGQAVQGAFSGKIVLTLLGLAAVQQFVVLLPVGLFMGIMLALGRLWHESELTAMQSCGLDNRRVLKPIVILALIAAAVLVWLSLEQAPQSSRRALEIRSEALRQARFSSLQPGKFVSFGGNAAIVFYAESVDQQGVLQHVYAERREGEELEIWTAKRAVQQGIGEQQQTFQLYEGRMYRGLPGNNQFRIIYFVEAGIPISLPEVARPGLDLDMRDTLALLRSDNIQEHAELQRRLSSPFMAIVLSLLAIPLAALKPRQGRYAKVGYFILIYLLYSGLIVVAGNTMALHPSMAWLGMWWVHGLFLLWAAVLWRLRGQIGFSRLWSRRS
jgi:lipopolysaccharide export system permease protein